MTSVGRRPRPEPVYLNVYDLNPQNETLFPLGLGAFHSGVEVHGQEWTFASGGGIFSHQPKNAQGAPLRVSILIGETAATSQEVAAIISRMRPDWPGSKYNVIKCNCNSFSDALLVSLCGKRAPGWVNRLSYLGNVFSCLLPASVTGAQAPVNSGSGGGGDYDASSATSTGYQVFPGRGGGAGSSGASRRSPPMTTAGGGGGSFSSLLPSSGGSTRGGASQAGGSAAAAAAGHTLGGGGPALGARPDRQVMLEAALRRQQAAATAATGGGASAAAPAPAPAPK